MEKNLFQENVGRMARTGGRLHAVEAPGNPVQVPMRDEKLALGIQTSALNPHHKPGLAPCLVVLGVLLPGLQVGLESTHAASTAARAGVLSADERLTLLQYAKDTWRSFDRLILPSGLPADGLRRDSEGRTTPWMQDVPNDIAAYLWSVLAAERLHLIGASEARSRLDRTLTTLAGMDRTHGFFVNGSTRVPESLSRSPRSTPARPVSASPRWTMPGWRSR